jgi:hypothetical protein
MTVGSLKEEFSSLYGFDRDCSFFGFPNRPFHDLDLNLMEFGILPGTIFHLYPSRPTVEAMELAVVASWKSGEKAFITTCASNSHK